MKEGSLKLLKKIFDRATKIDQNLDSKNRFSFFQLSREVEDIWKCEDWKSNQFLNWLKACCRRLETEGNDQIFLELYNKLILSAKAEYLSESTINESPVYRQNFIISILFDNPPLF